jgi:hypothetical protein
MSPRPLTLLLLLLTFTLFLAVSSNWVFNATKYTKHIRTIEHGKLFLTSATSPDGLTFEQPLIHVWGTDYYTQGYAQGRLSAESIRQMHFVETPVWFKLGDMARGSVNGYLPEDLQKLMKEATGDDIPKAMFTALDWVYRYQLNYTNSQIVQIDEEIKGIAQGFCDEINSQNSEKSKNNNKNNDKNNSPTHTAQECIPADAYIQIRAMNIFPELVRMGCTITASWGDAHIGLRPSLKGKKDDLISSRLLDFGVGPFVNNSHLIVRHFEKFIKKNNSVNFVTQGFPGFAGVVTSVSEFASQSQKVFLDFVDREGDSGHRAPESSFSSEKTQNELLIEKYIPQDERLNTKMDLIQANLFHVENNIRAEEFKSAKLNPKMPNSQTRLEYNTWFQNAMGKLNTPTWIQTVNEYNFLKHSYPTHSLLSLSKDDALIELWLEKITKQQFQLDSAQLQSYYSTNLSASPQNLHGTRPGNYLGLSDIFTIRILIELGNTLEQITALAQKNTRTWPIFLGFGTSIKTPERHVKVNDVLSPYLLMTYEREQVRLWNDETVGDLSTHNTMNSVIFIDRRPQPSPDVSMEAHLESQWGKFDIDWYLQTVPQNFSSGDVHAAIYDWNERIVYISVGRIDESYNWVENGKAFQRPWAAYNWQQLIKEGY